MESELIESLAEEFPELQEVKQNENKISVAVTRNIFFMARWKIGKYIKSQLK